MRYVVQQPCQIDETCLIILLQVGCYFELADASVETSWQFSFLWRSNSCPLVVVGCASCTARGSSLTIRAISPRFASCWTTMTAAAFSILFLHPAWSRHPISSIGSQGIWIVVSWVHWVVGAGLLNSAAPGVFGKRACGDVVYCGQIRALYGKSIDWVHWEMFADIADRHRDHSKVRRVRGGTVLK